MSDARLSPLSRRAVLSGAAALAAAVPFRSPALAQGKAAEDRADAALHRHIRQARASSSMPASGC